MPQTTIYEKLLFVVSIALICIQADSAHCQTSSAVSGSTSALPQSQEQKIAALEKKVDGLEKNVTEILQLLKARQQATPAISTLGDTPSPALRTPPGSTTLGQDGLLSGPILEAWPLPVNFRGNTPPGMSMGAMVDSGTLFNIDNFLSEDSFQSLKGSVVGLKWSGWIDIKERGNHNFILERDGGSQFWFVSLKIKGQTIFSSGVGVGALPHVETQALTLDPGFYQFELFTYSLDYPLYSRLQLRVRIRSESSPVPITLDAKTVFHRQ